MRKVAITFAKVFAISALVMTAISFSPLAVVPLLVLITFELGAVGFFLYFGLPALLTVVFTFIGPSDWPLYFVLVMAIYTGSTVGSFVGLYFAGVI
ncbi:MAG: hypothetical protein AAGF53_07075 [Pseudomonadota bacterium]